MCVHLFIEIIMNSKFFKIHPDYFDDRIILTINASNHISTKDLFNYLQLTIIDIFLSAQSNGRKQLMYEITGESLGTKNQVREIYKKDSFNLAFSPEFQSFEQKFLKDTNALLPFNDNVTILLVFSMIFKKIEKTSTQKFFSYISISPHRFFNITMSKDNVK